MVTETAAFSHNRKPIKGKDARTKKAQEKIEGLKALRLAAEKESKAK